MFFKTVDISTVISKIKDSSVLAISGFNMAITPEYLINGLFENLYKDQSQQFLQGTLMPFLGFSPWLQKMIKDNRIEYYCWPSGIAAYWFREIASGRPGLITKIGIDTFLDPRREGAALNELGKKMQDAKQV
jgi:acyl CoA:acetate/3-ketoacid CoA transferase